MTDAAEGDRDSEGGRMPHRIRTLLRVARRTRRNQSGSRGGKSTPDCRSMQAGTPARLVMNERSRRSAGFQPATDAARDGCRYVRNHNKSAGIMSAILARSAALLRQLMVRHDPCDCPSEVPVRPAGILAAKRRKHYCNRFRVIEPAGKRVWAS